MLLRHDTDSFTGWDSHAGCGNMLIPGIRKSLVSISKLLLSRNSFLDLGKKKHIYDNRISTLVLAFNSVEQLHLNNF
jgi:hypothetical protein